jgi:hypothetical protein
MKQHKPTAVGRARRDVSAPTALGFGHGQGLGMASRGNAFMQEQLRGHGQGAGQEEEAAEARGPLDLSKVIATGSGDNDAATPEQGGTTETAEGQEQAAEEVNFTLAVTNENVDGAGSGNFARTVVGVGEVCGFSIEKEGGGLLHGEDAAAGTWTASGGTGSWDGMYYTWQAPGVPGRYDVEFRVGSRSAKTSMTVLAPSHIAASIGSVLTQPRAGAGMELQLEFHPMTVSFENMEWFEQPGGASGGGYFDGNTIAHGTEQGAGVWVPMNMNNSGGDTVQMGDWPGPWEPGTHIWEIPTLYRAAGGPATPFHESVQMFEILNEAGDSQISKLGQSTSS